MEMKKIRDLAEGLASLTQEETNILADILEREYKIPMNDSDYSYPPNMVMGYGDETKSGFSLYLHNCNGHKLAALKAIKDHMAIGLREAKDVVDRVPTIVLDNVSLDEAKKLKRVLESFSCSTEIK